MATPKFRKSRANTHSRRSQWKVDNAALDNVKIDGQTTAVPRRLVKAAKLGLVDLDRYEWTTCNVRGHLLSVKVTT